MKILTKRNEDGHVVSAIDCPNGCKYFTCSMEEGEHCYHECEADYMCKLAEYEDLEEKLIAHTGMNFKDWLNHTDGVRKNCYTNISKLPDGTFFYVNNGCWQGYVTTENGIKVCYAGVSKKNPTEEYVNRFVVSYTYELNIDIL